MINSPGQSPYRWLQLWAASFGLVAVMMWYYFRVPVVPILLAGAVTFAMTFASCWMRQRRLKSSRHLW